MFSFNKGNLLYNAKRQAIGSSKGDIPDRMSSEYMPEDLPDRMPGKMSEGMPAGSWNATRYVR